MASEKSHISKGRKNFRAKLKLGASARTVKGLRLLCVVIAVTLPVALSLRGAWILGKRALNQQAQEIDRVRTQELRTQSKFLSEQINNQLELIKSRAAWIDFTHRFQAGSVDSSILAIAELNKADQVVKLIANSVSPELTKYGTASAMDVDVTKAIGASSKWISQKDLRDLGTSLIPLGLKSAEGASLVGIVFANPNENSLKDGRYLVALINPVQALSSIHHWLNGVGGREGEMLRGFLIDSNGRVLVHTESIYDGADFSGQPLFEQALRPLFRGEARAGVGIFAAADTLSARVSYNRLDTFPYAVVAERVVRSSSASIYTMVRDLAAPGLVVFAVIFLTCIASVFFLYRVFSTSSNEANSMVVVSPEFQAELETELRKFANEEESENSAPEDKILPPGAALSTPSSELPS